MDAKAEKGEKGDPVEKEAENVVSITHETMLLIRRRSSIVRQLQAFTRDMASPIGELTTHLKSDIKERKETKQLTDHFPECSDERDVLWRSKTRYIDCLRPYAQRWVVLRKLTEKLPLPQNIWNKVKNSHLEFIETLVPSMWLDVLKLAEAQKNELVNDTRKLDRW